MKLLFKLFLIVALLPVGTTKAQSIPRPRLVVGIVVDQMRWDYLYRFNPRYGSEGFNRLLHEGFSCDNTLIPYMPTYTAAGHACVYTGSVPSLHGIMGNSWYDKASGKVVYCVGDNNVQGVGSNTAAAKMSPANLWSTTVTDEIRLAQNFKNKSISVALKDRGSILPGGHTANAAYWFDNAVAGFISSNYYMQTLPAWVTQFNARKLPDVYLRQPWNTLYPLNTYTQSTADDKTYEAPLPGEDNVFPHVADTTNANKYEYFRFLPAANTYTLEMAKAAIAGENLGKQNNITDVLTVSLSSPDYMGHAAGPNAVEVEDMYLRLDKDLGAFLKYLDATIGKGQYLLFLTADHGVAHAPGFMTEAKIPAGLFDDVEIQRQFNTVLQKEFNAANIISIIVNYQVFLNDAVITQNKLDKKAIKQRVIENLLKVPGIAKAFDTEALPQAALPEHLKMMMVNSYNQKLSGDVQFLFQPQWFDGWEKGSSHGSWNPYDAHIPLLWFGAGIKPGRTGREIHMTDIAPTIAYMLQVQMPNASIGKVIEEVVK